MEIQKRKDKMEMQQQGDDLAIKQQEKKKKGQENGQIIEIKQE